MAPNQPPQDRQSCPHCGHAVPSPGVGAAHAPPPQPDASPSETQLNHALVQAQWVLARIMLRASETRDATLLRRCENLAADVVSCCADLSPGQCDDGALPRILMAAAELSGELSIACWHNGDEDEADELGTLTEALIEMALWLDPDFWTAEPSTPD